MIGPCVGNLGHKNRFHRTYSTIMNQ